MISALYLDRISSREQRHGKRKLYLIVSFVAACIAVLFPHISESLSAEWFIRLAVAVSTFSATAYMWKAMLELMHLSVYVHALRDKKDYWTEFAKQYTFFNLPFAREALLRLGIRQKDIPENMNVAGTGNDFASYITSIFTDNQEFRMLLEKNGITKAHWTGVWLWLEKREREYVESSLIFSDIHLAHLPSIGEAFSYGQTFVLSRLGKHMYGMSLPQSLEHFYARAFSLLDQSLKKSQGANVIIVCQSVEDGEEYIRAFVPHMNHKKFIELDTEALIAVKDASEFGKLFTRMLSESAGAGNIILVIPHITSLMNAAHAIGYDAALSLTEYMRSPDLHIIMIADKHEFHTTLATNVSIIQSADKIELDALAPEIIQSVAESEVLRTESLYHIVFSYQALAAVSDAVIRFGSEHMHDTLRDYLDEIALFNKRDNKKNRYITEQLVKKYIAEKTGTKGTFADATDISKPADVKEILSRRVKGQETAVLAVAQALERVRAGLNSAKRPLGTFLFLGPTGVGKTETAKALAEAYFGTEDKMTRFDMSEFSDANSISRLIGSFETGEAGLLASKARDAGHGVVLFDEIEKAHDKVRDLMLQILDEGYFSDARGNKVNMKNFIMIATSNAGSNEIYDAHASGGGIDKKALINHIIEQGIFKPEFLNRFDEIAVFNALGDRQLADIVNLKLSKYSDELYAKKTVHLKATSDLVHFIMNNIENKAFGGREIQRVIQNHVETAVAKDILSGVARTGSTVSFRFDNGTKSLVTMYT